MSGLKISMEKSTLFLAGSSVNGHQQIAETFPFEVGSLPVRYLGLPLVTKRLSTTDYLPLLEKIRKRINTWTARFLSFAGRLNLISSVIWSLCNFWTAAFRLPRNCIREIDKMCASFLWSGPEMNPKKAKVAWEVVCKPRQEGGLGLRCLKEANDVCCLKLIWKIVSKSNSLWVRWIEANLLKRRSFWSIKHTSSGSWIWRKLLKYRAVASSFFQVEVRNGQATSFWHDKWSDLGRLSDLVGARGIVDMGIGWQMSVAEAWVSRRRRRHREDLFVHMENALMVQHQKQNEETDTFLWKGAKDIYRAKFSTKDTWHHLRTVAPIVDWHRGVWFSHGTPKYSFCVWLAAQNRLSTRDRMMQWNVGASGHCILCNSTLETRNHLFFECDYSAAIWTDLAKNIFGSRFSIDWQTNIDFISGRSKHVEGFLARYVFQAVIYAIWRERNRRIHGEDPILPPRQILWLDKDIRNKLSSIRLKGDKRYDSSLQLWFASRI